MRSHRLQRNLDLRLFVTACQDRLQWANGASETHWRDLLDSRIKERVLPPTRNYQTRSEQKEEEIALVHRIAHLPRRERLAAWKEETGKSEPALYRRMKELNLGDSYFSHQEDQNEDKPKTRPPSFPDNPNGKAGKPAFPSIDCRGPWCNPSLGRGLRGRRQ
jgi:hypothetical protein